MTAPPIKEQGKVFCSCYDPGEPNYAGECSSGGCYTRTKDGGLGIELCRHCRNLNQKHVDDVDVIGDDE